MKASIIFLALIVSVSCSKNRNQKVEVSSATSSTTEQETIAINNEISNKEELTLEELNELENAAEVESINNKAVDEKKLSACPEKLADAVEQISAERKTIDLNIDLGLGSYTKTEQSEQISQKDLDDLIFTSTTNCEQLIKNYGATSINCSQSLEEAESREINTAATLEYCQAISKKCEELN